MNNKLKCPFCNGELVGTIGHPICRNQDCVMCDDSMPQDLLQELIRTRKALEIAVDMLKEIDKTRCAVDVKLYAVNHKSLNAGNVFCWATIDDLHNALEQITAKQKDK